MSSLNSDIRYAEHQQAVRARKTTTHEMPRDKKI